MPGPGGANVHPIPATGDDMDVALRTLARTQHDLVAAWQLREMGFSRRQIDGRAWRRRWRVVQPGVYALNQAPLTDEQRWLAACLTAPGTVLSHASAAACWGFRPWAGTFETVVRPGSGGPRRLGGVLVHRSATVTAEIAWRGHIPLTSPERTLIDLAPHLDGPGLSRATREAIRMRVTTAPAILAALSRHGPRRGTVALRLLATRYRGLPIARARSDAESLSLERLYLAGAPTPELNVRVAGHEADLVDHERRLILEIDGPQYHLFPDVDERKERAWRAAGYEVRRVSSDAVYE